MQLNEFVNEKNLLIYGVGKQQKDFQYVFNEILIEGYIDDDFIKKEWFEKNLYTLETFITDDPGKKYGYIICSTDKDKAIEKFKKKGLQYKQDYFFAEDFFTLLDYPIMKQANKKNIVLWGVGGRARNLLQFRANDFNIECFIDNDINKRGIDFEGYDVIHPTDIANKDWSKYYIVVTSLHYFSIKDQLEGYGLKENDDFICYELVESVSKLFAKTYYDTSYYDVECHSMLNHLDLGPHGMVHNCCATFLDAPIGNLVAQDIDAIWQSKRQRVFCVSALNKTFTFCKKNLCPVLINRKRNKYIEIYQDQCYAEPKRKPEAVNIAIDFSCNLYCETCRKQLRIASGQDKNEINMLTDKILNQIIPFTKFIMMAGNGEVFLSQAYEKIWSSRQGKDCEFFQILSNGVLFTEKKWELLMDGRSSDILFCVSIDAATEKTYRKIRRGGNWQVLSENMEFISKLRQQGQIKYLRMNFVVQKENYQEIPAFIEWGKQLQADRILFTKIINWGTYTDEEFSEISMVDAKGKPKKELQKILNMPICQDSIVDVGTFKWQHNYEETNFIDNYYLWEIRNYIANGDL